MKSDQWKKLDALIGRVLERPREERTAFLEEACGDDKALLEEARSLLAADDEATSFFAEEEEVQSPREARLGREIGAYRLLEVIGEGGMGTVYKAERSDGAFDKEVALKLLKPGALSDHWRQRFRTERHILGRLDHPHIATLLDGGNTDDQEPYLVMELVDGRPIDRYCREEKLSVKDRIVLLEKVCGAVAFAHQNLVVHRDLKPGNVLVNDEGEPRLLDFGIAKLLEPEMLDLTVEATQTHLRPMSPNHASPEQIVGGAITTATDVWALGALTYEILTGERPYASSRSLADLEAMRRTLPKAPSRVVEDSRVKRQVRGDLDTIVLKALRADPERRYGTAADLAADFRRFLRGLPVHARPDSLGYRLGKFVKRNRLPVSLVAASLVVITVLILGLFRQAENLRDERDKARQTVDLLVEVLGTASQRQNPGEEVTVREAMEMGEPVMREKLKDQPELLGIVLASIGGVYEEMNLTEEAKTRLEDAVGLLENKNSLTLAEAFWDLGTIEKNDGQFGSAKAYFDRAMAVSVKLDGENNAMSAAILKSLGIIENQKGNVEEAQRLFSRVVEMLEDTPIPEAKLQRKDYYIAKSQAEAYLGRFNLQQGRIDEAKILYLRSIETAEEGFPDVSKERAIAYFEMGRFYESNHQYSEAVMTVQRAVAILEEVLRPGHRDTAIMRLRLGRNLRKEDRLITAVDQLTQSYEALVEIYGPDSSLAGTASVNLLVSLAGLERWDEMKTLLSSTSGEALLKAFNYKSGWAVYCLMQGHLALGEADEAIETLEEISHFDELVPESKALILLARSELKSLDGEVVAAGELRAEAQEIWPKVPIPVTYTSYLSKEYE